MTNRTTNSNHLTLGCVKMLFHHTALTSLSDTSHLRSRVRMAAAKVAPNGSTSSMTNRTTNSNHLTLGCVKMLFHHTALTSLSDTRHLRSRVRMPAAKVAPNGSTSSITNRTTNSNHLTLGRVKMLFHHTALTSLSDTSHLRSRVRMAAAKVAPNLRTLNYERSNFMFIQAQHENALALLT
jgi:hypothetical protein